MAVYVMADTHLSGSVEKPMDKFGTRWTDYTEKIRVRWSRLVDDCDTVVIPGDFSWAMTLDEAEEDFRFISSLPGRKIISKGNHDYWWTTVKKMHAFLDEKNIGGIEFLYNNAFVRDGVIISGSRGWFIEEKLQSDSFEADYSKIISRECERLSRSIAEGKKLGDGFHAVFLHFPPVFGDFICQPIIDILKESGVDHVYYGHIHSNYSVPPTFIHDGLKFSLISSDYLDFIPQRVFI